MAGNCAKDGLFERRLHFYTPAAALRVGLAQGNSAGVIDGGRVTDRRTKLVRILLPIRDVTETVT